MVRGSGIHRLRRLKRAVYEQPKVVSPPRRDALIESLRGIDDLILIEMALRETDQTGGNDPIMRRAKPAPVEPMSVCGRVSFGRKTVMFQHGEVEGR